MLHITFAELMRRGAQEMLAGEGGLGMHQRHHVLQLIAEAEGATGLVKAGAGPQAAAQGLVQQPAVGHHINGGIWGFDLHGTKRPIPILPDSFEGRMAGLRGAIAADQGLHISDAPPHPEAEGGFLLLPGKEIKGHLHCGARVQPRSCFP